MTVYLKKLQDFYQHLNPQFPLVTDIDSDTIYETINLSFNFHSLATSVSKIISKGDLPTIHESTLESEHESDHQSEQESAHQSDHESTLESHQDDLIMQESDDETGSKMMMDAEDSDDSFPDFSFPEVSDHEESDHDHEMDNESDDASIPGSLDDDFFSHSKIQKFAEQGELLDLNESQNPEWSFDPGFSCIIIDMFNCDPDDLEGSESGDDAINVMYDEYFKQPKKNLNTKDLETKETEEEEPKQDEPIKEKDVKKNLIEESVDSSGKSSHEIQMLKINQQIKALEADLVAEKPWQLSGEVSSKSRPLNSLLEHDIEIEHASRPVPVITEETTKTLEDVIKSRIQMSLFDNVERKVLETTKQPKKRKELNDEKPGSLVAVYETEYEKQAQKDAKIATKKELEMEKQYKIVDEIFLDLCADLDALSHWNYSTSANIPEMEVVNNAPALTLEEVIPAVVSDAALVAPKEVYEGNVGKSNSEMDKDDKKRARKKQKLAKKHEAKNEAKSTDASNVIENVANEKQKAVESLMKQKNVTLVADGKRGKGSVHELGGMKGKGKKGKLVKGTVVNQGESVEKVKKVVKPEMLRL